MRPQYQTQKVQQESCPQAAGCHLGIGYLHTCYPTIHHKVQENLEVLNIQGRSRILYGCGRGMRLLQLELVDLILEVSNLVVSVCELNLLLLQLLLMLL
jgi:hypothetical protein